MRARPWSMQDGSQEKSKLPRPRHQQVCLFLFLFFIFFIYFFSSSLFFFPLLIFCFFFSHLFIFSSFLYFFFSIFFSPFFLSLNHPLFCLFSILPFSQSFWFLWVLIFIFSHYSCSLSILPSIHPSIHPPIHPSIHPSIHPPIHPSRLNVTCSCYYTSEGFVFNKDLLICAGTSSIFHCLY